MLSFKAWRIIGTLVVLAGLIGAVLWGRVQIAKLETQVAKRDGSISTLNQSVQTLGAANQSMTTALTAVSKGIDIMKQMQDRQDALMSAHYAEQNKITQSFADLSKGRADAHLSDGAVSDDLRYSLRGVRALTQSYNDGQQAGVPAPAN